MNQKLTFTALLAAVLTMGLIAGGCAQHSKAKSSSPTMEHEPTHHKAETPAHGEKTRMTYSSGSAAYFPSGVASSSVLKVNRTAPTQVGVGEEFSYTITATNTSSKLALNDVVITETVDGALNVTSSDPQAQKAGSDYSWNLGTLMPGQSKTIKVNAKASSTGEIVRCVTAAYVPVVCVVTKVVKPQLTLEKTGPAEVLKCDPITYKFTVRNPGTGPANNVVIKDTLPDGLVTASGGKSDVSINVGTLAAGQAKAYSLAVKATKAGTFNNSATASSGSLSASDGHKIVVKEPKLTVVGESPERRYLNKTACHSYTVKNFGNGVAKNATVTIMMSGGTFKSATGNATPTGNTVKYSLGDLAPGESKTVEVCHTATSKGKITSKATASAYCAEAVTDDEETRVEGIPAVLLEVVDLDDPIEVGTNVTYKITVTNQGSEVDQNIKVTATLPDGLDFVGAGGATKANVAGKTVTFAPLASLAPKAETSWTLTAKATKEATVKLAVKMTTDFLKGQTVDETEATNLYE